MRPPSFRPATVASALGLVVANAVPLVGVVWFGWSLYGVMWLYWAENGVIGAFAVLRIVGARSGGGGEKLFLGPFFVVHFGIFWAVHGAFVADLFADRGDAGVLTALVWGGAPEGLAALALSHGGSFLVHYVWGGEWRAASAKTEMFKPYGRVVLLHLVILGGAALVAATGTTVAALALLVGLKTALDLGVHVVAHRMRYAAAGADPEPRTVRPDRHPTLGR